MAGFSALPVELHRHILSYVREPFDLHRVERVCVLWNAIVADFERRGLKFRRKKIFRRLKQVDSMNESLSIADIGRVGFKQGSQLQERAEKVFMSHMEIIRLKHPTRLDNLRQNPRSEFGLIVAVSKSIILLGIGVFLPHGENLQGPLRITVWIQEYAAQVHGPRGRRLEEKTLDLSIRQQLDHARMCIDPELGHSTRAGVECLSPPRAIDSQRKAKRRCFGIHPWPVEFDQSVELLSDRPYHIGLQMRYLGDGGGGRAGGPGELPPVETVWGGGGEQEMICSGLAMRFTRCNRADVRSSATKGQIPFLLYI